MANTEFDRHADGYENEVARAVWFSGRDPTFFRQAKVRTLLWALQRNVGAPNSLSGVDFGCGVGLFTRDLAPHVRNVVGVDVSRDMLERARELNPGVRFDLYDGTRLPYADRSFDFLLAASVLHHVDPGARQPLVAEMGRVVRTGGLVALFEHNPLNPLTRLVVSRCSFDEHARLIRRQSAVRLLESAGMSVSESRYFLVLPSESRLSLAVEERVSRLPLGAQYLVAGRPG
jgi:SAM-dependent methyltransferase